MTDVDRDDEKLRNAVAAAMRQQPPAADADRAWHIVQTTLHARRTRWRYWQGALATVAAAAVACVALVWWGHVPDGAPGGGQLGTRHLTGQTQVDGETLVPQVRVWPDIDAAELDRIKAGDIVKGMTVVSIGPFSERMPMGEANVRIVFVGRQTVRGQYTYHGPDGLTPDSVSFEVDLDASAALPQLGTERAPWFFFSNDDEAKAHFGPPGSRGEATIVIDNYVIERFPGHGAFDRAELVEVLAAEPLPESAQKR